MSSGVEVVAIHQPEHLPWLGYLDKLARADVFVLLDTVQFKKHYFDNRNRIRTPDGWLWLTVPVLSRGRFGQPIRDVEINAGDRWQPRYWRSVELNYRRAPHFGRYAPFLAETFLQRDWKRLVDLNVHLIRWAAEQFGLERRFVLASDLGVEGAGSRLLADIVEKLGARTYLSGISGRDYLDEAEFRARGIAVQYQAFHHPVYRQAHGSFEPRMAFIDLLMNHGPESGRLLLDECTERLTEVFS